MATLKDIVDIILAVRAAWKDHRQSSDVPRKEIFDKYIAPSYTMMKAVHSNYLGLFVELEQRLQLDGEVTAGTVAWFSAARTQFQVDRSELQMIQVPKNSSSGKASVDLRAALDAYLFAVREYFVPSCNLVPRAWERIRSSFQFTPSSAIEERMWIMAGWKALLPVERRMLVAEDVTEQRLRTVDERQGREELIDTLMRVTLGETPAGIGEQIAAYDREAQTAATTKQRVTRAALNEYGQTEVLQSHIHMQRWELESAMTKVQEAYFRVRLIADRG